MTLFTLQAPRSDDPALLAELAGETFSDLDRARDVALALVQEFGADVAIHRHSGPHSVLWELYDAATYA